MPRSGKAKSKKKAPRTTVKRRKAAADQAVMLLPGQIDWAEEIELLFTDLARELCDSPEKCKMLVLRLTLRDGSEYLISGHGKRVAQHADGTLEIVCMHFIGQDSRKRHIALSVRPEDVFKIELVDVPEKEERPPFGFATKIHGDGRHQGGPRQLSNAREGVADHADQAS